MFLLKISGWNSSSEEGTILSCQEESEDFDDYYGYKGFFNFSKKIIID